MEYPASGNCGRTHWKIQHLEIVDENPGVVITEPPLPDLAPTPPNSPRLARSRPKRARSGLKWIELDIFEDLWGGAVGVCRDGGAGGCKGKEKSLP